MGVTAHWLDDIFGTDNKFLAVRLALDSHSADITSRKVIQKGIGLMNA